MTGIDKAIVYADLHAPHEDKYAVSILCQVIQDEKPDILINLGDGGEFDSVNYFNRNRPLKQEGKRLVKDFRDMIHVENEIISAAPEAKKRKHTGNHEHRVNNYLDSNPIIEGLIEETIQFNNSVEVIPHGKFSTVGKLMFHHGDRKGYKSIHHAKQWSSIGRSILYAHFHSVQRFTHETLHRDGKPDKHAAFSIGCLCKLDRDWMYNQKSLWQQSFGVVYFQKDGFFNFYNIDITNRRAIWNGRIYRG